MSQFSRSELVSLDEMCYKSYRHEDVISYMKQVIKMGTPLNFEERTMIFNSYSQLTLPYINSFISCDDSSVDEKLQREINQKSKSETNRICDEAIELLDSYWIKRDNNIEAVADYKRFRAIQHEYIAVTASGHARNFEISKAMKLYEEAYEIASKNLSPAHPLVILIALNFSSFHYFIPVFVDKALAIATEAYNKGLSHLHEIPEELKFHANRLLATLKKKIDDLKQL